MACRTTGPYINKSHPVANFVTENPNEHLIGESCEFSSSYFQTFCSATIIGRTSHARMKNYMSTCDLPSSYTWLVCYKRIIMASLNVFFGGIPRPYRFWT